MAARNDIAGKRIPENKMNELINIIFRSFSTVPHPFQSPKVDENETVGKTTC